MAVNINRFLLKFFRKELCVAKVKHNDLYVLNVLWMRIVFRYICWLFPSTEKRKEKVK